MKLQLYKHVILTRDVPEEDMKAGDIAILVDFATSADGEKGGILEVFNALGESIRVTAVPLSALAMVSREHVSAARLPEEHTA